MTRLAALLLGLLLSSPALGQQSPFPAAVEVQPSKMQLEMLKRGKVSESDCPSDHVVGSCPAGTPDPCCIPRTSYDCGAGVYVAGVDQCPRPPENYTPEGECLDKTGRCLPFIPPASK